MNNEFINAVETGNIDKVRLLLENPEIDPATNNNEAIRVASGRGHTEVVRMLLADPRTNPASNNNYPIRLASKNGHTEIVKLLLADPRTELIAPDLLTFICSINTPIFSDSNTDR